MRVTHLIALLTCLLVALSVSAAPVKAKAKAPAKAPAKASAKKPVPAPAPAPAPGAGNFLPLTGSALKSAKAFVEAIPDDKLLAATDASNSQGTIFTLDASGRSGGRPSTGFRLDRQKPPSAGSGIQAQLQIQLNGKNLKGPSSVGGVFISTGATPSAAQMRTALTQAVVGAKFVTVGTSRKRDGEVLLEARVKKPVKKPSTPAPAAKAPAAPAPKFLKLSGKSLKSVQAFVDNIPDDKLLAASDASNNQGTIFTVDANGRSGGRPTTGFRLDRQKPPSANSAIQAQLQVQINGVTKGITSVGGVFVSRGATPSPASMKKALLQAVTSGTFVTV